MSRVEINIPNTNFKMVFGVDHVTSTFVSIYDTTQDPDEENEDDEYTSPYYVFMVNNLGVCRRVSVSPSQLDFINSLKSRFELAKKRNNFYPNLSTNDVIDIGVTFGIEKDNEEFKKKVFETLDQEITMNTTEVNIEKIQITAIVLSLKNFTNEELAAFNLSITGFGKINKLNKAYSKALNCSFINIDGNPESGLKELLIEASSYEVNRRVKEGIFV